jgi:hypothetical protein
MRWDCYSNRRALFSISSLCSPACAGRRAFTVSLRTETRSWPRGRVREDAAKATTSTSLYITWRRRLYFFSLLCHRRRPSTCRRLALQSGAIHCNWLRSKLRNLLAHRLIPLAPCLSIGNARRAVSSSRPAAAPPWSGRCGQVTPVSFSFNRLQFRVRSGAVLLVSLTVGRLSRRSNDAPPGRHGRGRASSDP